MVAIDIDNPVNVTYLIISIVIGIGAVGGLLFQLGRWLNRRSTDKIEELKTQNDSIAKQVEEREEKRAKDVLQTSTAVLDKIKNDSTERDGKLQLYLTKVADDYRQINARHITDLETTYSKRDDVVEQRLEKIEDSLDMLTKRNDLINGNIASIRADITDLAEDLADVSTENEPPIALKARQRAQRLKRRRIEADRVAQQEH